jgi:hypothetical protein
MKHVPYYLTNTLNGERSRLNKAIALAVIALGLSCPVFAQTSTVVQSDCPHTDYDELKDMTPDQLHKAYCSTTIAAMSHATMFKIELDIFGKLGHQHDLDDATADSTQEQQCSQEAGRILRVLKADTVECVGLDNLKAKQDAILKDIK